MAGFERPGVCDTSLWSACEGQGGMVCRLQWRITFPQPSQYSHSDLPRTRGLYHSATAMHHTPSAFIALLQQCITRPRPAQSSYYDVAHSSAIHNPATPTYHAPLTFTSQPQRSITDTRPLQPSHSDVSRTHGISSPATATYHAPPSQSSHSDVYAPPAPTASSREVSHFPGLQNPTTAT